jgi:hypothetical protein
VDNDTNRETLHDVLGNELARVLDANYDSDPEKWYVQVEVLEDEDALWVEDFNELMTRFFKTEPARVEISSVTNYEGRTTIDLHVDVSPSPIVSATIIRVMAQRTLERADTWYNQALYIRALLDEAMVHEAHDTGASWVIVALALVELEKLNKTR